MTIETIDQLEAYGQRDLVEAELADSVLWVQTENIRTLSFGPIGDQWSVDLQQKRQFQRDQQGGWKIGSFNLFGQKTHQKAGPINDLFYDELLLVPGTIGTEEARFFNTWVADNAAPYFRRRNYGRKRSRIDHCSRY